MVIKVATTWIFLLSITLNTIGLSHAYTAQNECQLAQDNKLTIKQTLKCFLPLILASSKELAIDPALVLAIIHQESAFNTNAISSSNALGLMQIMQQSSAVDVTNKLVGQDVILPTSFIINPSRNITLGIQYLSILKHQYLKQIKNSDSQRLAIIAAYNGGIGSLQRWYLKDASTEKDKGSLTFFQQVNVIPSEKFKQLLIYHHPFKETRDYVKKVEQHYQFYKALLAQY